MIHINGNYPGEHIASAHVTGKIGPRNPMPKGGTPPSQPPKKRGLFGWGCGPLALVLLIALGSAVLGIAGLVDIFGRAA